MTDQKSKSARLVAAEALNQFDPKRNYVGPILDRLLQDTAEKQRATDLVFGSVRNRRAIDTVIATFSGRPVERIPRKLLSIIRIGVYELIYSPATEVYSIVNEAVENAKAVAAKKQAGFVNAVLRQITRHITNRQIQLSQADATRTLPQTSATGCEFDTSFLPDGRTHPAEYLSAAFSLPKWLISGWLSEFGEESTRQICLASNRRPSIYVRPNRLRTTTEGLAEMLRLENIEFEIVDTGCSMPDARRVSRIEHRESRMMRIRSPRAVTQLPGFSEGLFVVQDITASQAVQILGPQPGWTIFDLCAAPGVKTTQLAEAAGDSARIVATDIDSRRLEMVRENTARLGINSVTVVGYENLRRVAAEIGPFDTVLLDVPCSNTGVLARRIEARYRVNANAVKELAKVQSKLLVMAAAMIKPQGKICYSTCSIQNDENSNLIRDFLQKDLSFKLESETLTLPSAEGFDHDGGYVAIVTRE